MLTVVGKRIGVPLGKRFDLKPFFRGVAVIRPKWIGEDERRPALLLLQPVQSVLQRFQRIGRQIRPDLAERRLWIG